MEVIGLNRQFNHRPVVFYRYRTNNLFQTRAYWTNQHLAPPLGTPDDMVHDKVCTVLFVLILHIDNVPYDNTDRKARGPFIPRMNAGACWPLFCNLRPGWCDDSRYRHAYKTGTGHSRL